MLDSFQEHRGPREIYFHEDDYCQQQILPASEGAFARTELERISDFSREHQAPGGIGWTDMYLREDPSRGLDALGFQLAQLDHWMAGIFPKFDVVYTGYSTYRQNCKSTAAWGLSDSCCIFADWNDAGIIDNVWTSFFDETEESVRLSARAVAALASHTSLVFVDWAWGYACDPGDEKEFIRLLTEKLKDIQARCKQPPDA